MSIRSVWKGILAAVLLAAVGAGCDNGGGGGISRDFGDNDPDVYVCLGDSITHGYGQPAGESYPAQLGGILGKTVYNLGTDGERSDSGADRVSGVLARYKPGYLFVLYGANDVIHFASDDSIVANLRSIVQQAKANKTVPVVGTLTPMTRGHAFFGDYVATLNPKIEEMALQEGVEVANLFGAFGSDEALLQDDGLHLTAEGARIVATTFAAASK
jgi:lysophospholipase L1-like esterase